MRVRARKITEALWTRLLSFYDKDLKEDRPTPKVISIPTNGKSAQPDKPMKPSEIPLLRTRSALGIMKNAAGTSLGPGQITIDTPEVISKLIREKNELDAEKGQTCTDYFYTVDRNTKALVRINPDRPSSRSLVTTYPEKSHLSPAEISNENKLAGQRAFMLVARSKYLPNDSFASVYDNGYYYYIFNDDKISKQTLALIAQFNTILASGASTPLTPTISVGARM